MTDTDTSLRLDAIAAVTRALGGAHTLDNFFATVVAVGTELFGTPDFYLYVRDETSGSLSSPLARTERHLPFNADQPARQYYPANPPLAVAVAAEGAPIVADDYGDACRARGLTPIALPDDLRPLGWLGVPMLLNGRVLGVLATHKARRVFGGADVETLSIIATQTALSIEHLRLSAEARRRQDEFAGQEQAGELAAIFRSIPDRLEIFDRDGVRRMVNQAATAHGNGAQLMIGASPEDRIARWQMRTLDGTPLTPDHLPSVRALRGEIVADQVLVARGERGDFFTSESGAPIYDARGQIVGAVTVGRDVTEQLRAERQREALRAIIEDISAQLDLGPLLDTLVARAVQLIGGASGTITLIEPGTDTASIAAAYNLRGMKVGVTLAPGEGLTALVRERRAPVIIDDYEALAKPVPVDEEVRRYASVAAPIWWQDEIIGNLSVVSRDPTYRFTQADADLLTTFARHAAIAITNARLYDAMRASEERFRALTGSAPDMIYTLDTERRITYINDRVTDTLGYTPAEVIGKSAFTFVAPESHAAFGMDEEIPVTPNPYARGELLARDGTRVPVEIHTTVLRCDGAVVGMQGIARDIRQTMALEAELHEQTREYAAIAERQRLARELHDSVTQTLFSMTLIARAAQRQYTTAPEQAGDWLEQLATMSQGALAEMRSLLFQLRPEAIAGAGIADAIKKHLAAVESRDGLRATLTIEGSERRDGASVLTPPRMEALFRITQEGLANVVKHARATEATVTLRFLPGEIVLLIADNGIGYTATEPTPARNDLPAGASGGMGLRGIRERLAPLDGRLEIVSSPSAGTMLRITLPLVQHTEAPA